MTDAEPWTRDRGLIGGTDFANHRGENLAQLLDAQSTATASGVVNLQWTFPDGSAVLLGAGELAGHGTLDMISCLQLVQDRYRVADRLQRIRDLTGIEVGLSHTSRIVGSQSVEYAVYWRTTTCCPRRRASFCVR